MPRFLTMSLVSLSPAFGVFAADKPAPKAVCTCKTFGCKSCAVWKGKHRTEKG